MVKETSPVALSQRTEAPSLREIKRLQDQLKDNLGRFCSHFRSTPQVKLTTEIIYATNFVDQWTNYFTDFFTTLKTSSELTQRTQSLLSVDLCKQVQWSLFRKHPISENDREIFSNFYHRRMANISLAEMEELPTPLSLDNFQKLTDYFKEAATDNLCINFNPSMPRMFEYIAVPFMYLAASEKPPQKIAPLIKVAKAYFDFWQKTTIDYQIDEFQEEEFLRYFRQWPQDKLSLFIAVLNNFQLAHFQNFTIFQILHSRKNQSLNPQGWESLINNFFNAQEKTGEVLETTKASQKLIEGYSQTSYKPESEEQIALLLTQGSGHSDISIDEYARLIISNENLSDQITAHPEQLTISQISLPTSDNYKTESTVLGRGLNKVTVVLSKKSFPFLILDLEGSPSPLLVQLTDKGKVLGIPWQIETETKALYETVKNSLLTIYLEYLNYRQKAREPQDNQNSTCQKASLSKEQADLPKISPVLNYASPQKTQSGAPSSKRRSQKSLQFPAKTQSEEKTPQGSNEPRHRKVFYTRDQLNRLLKDTPDKELQHVLRALHSFEAGLGDVKKLRKSRYGTLIIDQNTFRLRVGKIRILLRKNESDIYLPIFIGRRQSGSRYSLA